MVFFKLLKKLKKYFFDDLPTLEELNKSTDEGDVQLYLSLIWAGYSRIIIALIVVYILKLMFF